MDMPPVYVLVHIYNVRLVAIAHSLHILPGQFRELQIREPVVQRRVQRYMQDWLFCILVGKQVVVKRPQGLLHDTLRVPRHIGNHAVPVNDAGCIVVHFLLVVDDCTVERSTSVDFSHHFPPPSVVLSDSFLQTHGSA